MCRRLSSRDERVSIRPTVRAHSQCATKSLRDDLSLIVPSFLDFAFERGFGTFFQELLRSGRPAIEPLDAFGSEMEQAADT